MRVADVTIFNYIVYFCAVELLQFQFASTDQGTSIRLI